MPVQSENSYRWVIVAAGALMTCVAVGTMFSLAVYLPPMTAATGWSRAGISSAMSIDFLAMGLAGFGWGAITDRFGPRIAVLSGAIILGLGQVLASRRCENVVGQSQNLRRSRLDRTRRVDDELQRNPTHSYVCALERLRVRKRSGRI